MTPWALYLLRQTARRFHRDESGAGAVMGFFCLILCLMVLSLGLDVSNAWRSKKMLTLTADVAAHTGAVAMAHGDTPGTILKKVRRAVERNMPEDRHGPLLREDEEDITLVHYDPETGELLDGRPINAVSVTLHRNHMVDNPVPTYLAGLIGISSWNMTAKSIVAVDETQRCSGAAGLYAQGELSLAAESRIGSGVCLHSQDHVTLHGRNTFEPFTYVSMPNLSDCRGTCDEVVHPGITAVEVNLVTPKTKTFVRDMSQLFLRGGMTSDMVAAYFTGRPISEYLSALDEVGVSAPTIKGLETADRVRLKPIQFERMREYPQGLVYQVDCAAPGQELLVGEAPFSPPLQNIVLITDCSLYIGQNADIRGSILISTYDTDTTVTAHEDARAGDPDETCRAGLQTVIMTRGDMELPESFVRSNISLIAGGDVTLSGLPLSVRSVHNGLSVHAGGNLKTARYEIRSCDDAPTTATPDLDVIRHVMIGG